MLKIGWSQKDVTTYEPVNIPGQFYARISRGVYDPITITSLCISDDNDFVIFVSGDFVSFGDDIITDIRTAVSSKNSAIPTEKIILFATHTHTSPSFYRHDILSSIPESGLEYSHASKYRPFLVEQISQAIAESFDNLSAGGVSYGFGFADIGFCRRVLYKDDISRRPDASAHSSYWIDGKAKMYGNTNDKNFCGYESANDSFVNIMFTFDKNEKLTGAIVNIPCPAQTSEGEYYLSAGYWNEVREKIRASYGDIYILPQCAASGDLAPRMLHYQNAEKRKFNLKYKNIENDFNEIHLRHEIAEKVKNAFDDVFSWAKEEIYFDYDLKHSVKILPLQKRFVTEEEYKYCEEKYEAVSRKEFVYTDFPLYNIYKNSRIISEKLRFESVFQRYERQKTKKTIDTEIHIVTLGDIAFTTNPFELFIDFQHCIQAQSPFIQTFVIELCAFPDKFAFGYLATEKANENKGYSASVFSNYISSKGGEELCRETIEELIKMKNNLDKK